MSALHSPLSTNEGPFPGFGPITSGAGVLAADRVDAFRSEVGTVEKLTFSRVYSPVTDTNIMRGTNCEK